MNDKRLIIKPAGEAHRHHTETFRGSPSHRRVLPRPDAANVKVTEFHPEQGFMEPKICYDWDETVFVHAGRVRVWQESDRSDAVVLEVGSVYVVPAGVSYGLEALEYSILVCVFSSVPGGLLPDDK